MDWTIHFQADATIVDSTGREHPVHSTLLRLKIPLFCYMEMEPNSTILMDFASPEVVDFLCEVVYGSDRWFNLFDI